MDLYTITCDRCGLSGLTRAYLEPWVLRLFLRHVGWTYVDGRDVCPRCFCRADTIEEDTMPTPSDATLRAIGATLLNALTSPGYDVRLAWEQAAEAFGRPALPLPSYIALARPPTPTREQSVSRDGV